MQEREPVQIFEPKFLRALIHTYIMYTYVHIYTHRSTWNNLATSSISIFPSMHENVVSVFVWHNHARVQKCAHGTCAWFRYEIQTWRTVPFSNMNIGIESYEATYDETYARSWLCRSQRRAYSMLQALRIPPWLRTRLPATKYAASNVPMAHGCVPVVVV